MSPLPHHLSDAQLLAECDVDTFRSSGPGGQHVNKTESAVRLRHRPTGIAVTSQRDRSQHRNRKICLEVLRERLARLHRREKPRIPTSTPARVRRRTLEGKVQRGRLKQLRRRPSGEE